MAEANYLENVIVVINGQEKQLNMVPEIRNQILNPEIMNLTDAEEQIEEVIDEVTGNKENKISAGNANGYIVKKHVLRLYHHK